MRKITTLLLLGLLSTLLLTGCHQGTTEDEEPEIGTTWSEIDRGLCRDLSAKDFDKLVRTFDATKLILHEQKPTIIEVYRPDCSHCVKLKPYMAKLSRELGQAVPIYMVNSRESDESSKIVSKLQISSVPTLFLIYKDGSYVTLKPTSKWKGDGELLPGLRSEVALMLKSYLR